MGIIPINPTDLPQKLSRNTKFTRTRKNKKTLGNNIEERPNISDRAGFRPFFSWNAEPFSLDKYIPLSHLSRSETYKLL